MRYVVLLTVLAACASAPEPAVIYPITGPAADTSFTRGAQTVAAEVAANVHQDIMNQP